MQVVHHSEPLSSVCTEVVNENIGMYKELHWAFKAIHRKLEKQDKPWMLTWQKLCLYVWRFIGLIHRENDGWTDVIYFYINL